jgi:CHASE2 domain-containing sensor protein
MRISFFIFISCFVFQLCCNIPKVKLTNQIDPDIVLVNIGDVDRTAIADMLLRIDSCRPAVIAVDAWFIEEKDSLQDSKLINALKTIKKDILSYALDSLRNPVKSHKKFSSLVLDDGLAMAEKTNGLSDRFIPVRKIKNHFHEHFALKICRIWKPGLRYKFKTNKSMQVNFIRTLDRFIHVEGVDINANLVDNIFKDKIVMLGYLGPSDDDKHFTPLRFVKDYPDNAPDTYGVVILANSVRTILDYDNQ